MTAPALLRALLPFLMIQAAVSTSLGFAGVVVYAQGGFGAVVRYTALMLTAVVAGIVLPLALGRRLRLRTAHLLRGAFVVPAVLMWWADGRPVVLALACGGFLGLSWAARHSIELALLADAERDAYTSQATVWSVLTALATTLLVTVALTLTQDAPIAIFGSYALLATAGALLPAARMPVAPSLALHRPWQVLSQPAYLRALPLYFLESGMFGVGLVLGASGAVQSLEKASHYGWAASAAAVAGALALYALRHHRQPANRRRWMWRAAAGMVLAHTLLGAASIWPGLFVLHLLALAAAQPFWQASEQVLNLRALDLHGEVADRIAVRETTLWVFRVSMLALFAALVADWDSHRILQLGSVLMAAAVILVSVVARAWLPD